VLLPAVAVYSPSTVQVTVKGPRPAHSQSTCSRRAAGAAALAGLPRAEVERRIVDGPAAPVDGHTHLVGGVVPVLHPDRPGIRRRNGLDDRETTGLRGDRLRFQLRYPDYM